MPPPAAIAGDCSSDSTDLHFWGAGAPAPSSPLQEALVHGTRFPDALLTQESESTAHAESRASSSERAEPVDAWTVSGSSNGW